MVDLQAVSQKLIRRSENILKQLTGRNAEEVCDALRQANGSVKLAVLLLNGCDLEAATSILDHAGGQLRAALTAIGKPCPDPADLTQVEAPEMY
jgi:N-acetylmuramic acid 6-phosphate etherase